MHCLLTGWLALAALFPPARPGVVPRLAVLDEHDDRRELGAMGTPTLLLPIFTRCSRTCPLTALALKDALAHARAPFRVVFFSFDPGDGAEELREFRERLELPAGWLLVRSPDGAATRAFFDALEFHFMKAGGGFDHPSQTFVLSPKGAWAATMGATEFSRDELETAYQRALSADDPSLVRKAAAWLLRPEAWIALACAGIAASLTTVLLARKAAASPMARR